jgi:hypothetical protein
MCPYVPQSVSTHCHLTLQKDASCGDSIGYLFLFLPNLASLTPFVRQRQAGKVNGMNTPQQLSREAIEEFKAIYHQEFGEVLSDDEVQEIAMRLLRFFGILNKEK